MSLPRLPFLYPALRRAHTTLRYRHGTAVEPPVQLHPTPPSPPQSKINEIESISKLVNSDNSEARENLSEPLAENVEANNNNESSKQARPPTKPPAKPSTTDRVNGNFVNGLGERVHHFDTFSNVQRLEQNGGFTRGQAVALMKGIRSLLYKNMDDARNSLVSKSDVENETYLFQAACSELRNEMQNTKKIQIDQLRSDRTRIQTDFDLLNQAFLAEIMALKDELNMMFNDRKMVTRAEQRAMENKIQELNYKITISLQSELKSEIEKLRWITTRRGLIAIATLALFVVTAIRINNSSTEKRNKEKREKERKKREKEENAMSMASVHNDHQHGTVVHTEAGLVSLG